jgi:hypothetical protein
MINIIDFSKMARSPSTSKLPTITFQHPASRKNQIQVLKEAETNHAQQDPLINISKQDFQRPENARKRRIVDNIPITIRSFVAQQLSILHQTIRLTQLRSLQQG